MTAAEGPQGPSASVEGIYHTKFSWTYVFSLPKLPLSLEFLFAESILDPGS